MNKIGFSQKAIILNTENKILALRRSKTAPVRPLTWDLPGGDLEVGEDPIEGMSREIKEETGLDIASPEVFDVEAHINTNGEYWLTIAYKAKIDSRKIILSREHDEYRWLTTDEFLKLESAEKLQRFVRKLKEKQ